MCPIKFQSRLIFLVLYCENYEIKILSDGGLFEKLKADKALI
jgi:hypothetical protein